MKNNYFLLSALVFSANVFCMPKENNIVNLLRKRQEGVSRGVQNFQDGSKGIFPANVFLSLAPLPKGNEPKESYSCGADWELSYEDQIQQLIYAIKTDWHPERSIFYKDGTSSYSCAYYRFLENEMHPVARAYQKRPAFADFILTLISNRFDKNKQIAFEVLYSTLINSECNYDEENYSLFRKMVQEYNFNVNFLYIFKGSLGETEETPLHNAVRGESIPLVSLLLTLGARSDKKNGNNQMPEEVLKDIKVVVEKKNYPSRIREINDIFLLLESNAEGAK